MEPTTETVDNYEYNLRCVLKTLKKDRGHHALRPGYVYRGDADFLLQHGTAYKPTPWRGQYEQGLRKMCYGTAVVMGAAHGLRYVEGVSLSPYGVLIPHAWNLSAEGELLDCTWSNGGLVYFGVEFSVERADDATWNGDACVLDDWRRRWPLFKQRWTGEDYSLTWPYSDRLAALRGETDHFPASVIAHEEARAR